VPEKLWVDAGDGQVTRVSTKNCDDVEKLKNTIKEELELPWIVRLFGLYVKGKPGNPLDPMMLLRDAVAKHGIRSDTVLIAKLIQPQGGKSSFFSIF
jgi:hypothetical protein